MKFDLIKCGLCDSSHLNNLGKKNYFNNYIDMKNFNNKSEDCIMFKNILFTMMFLVSSVMANTLGLGDNGNGTWNVSYSSEEPIAGLLDEF